MVGRWCPSAHPALYPPRSLTTIETIDREELAVLYDFFFRCPHNSHFANHCRREFSCVAQRLRETTGKTASGDGRSDQGVGSTTASRAARGRTSPKETVRRFQDLLRLPHQVLRHLVDLAPWTGDATL